MAADDILVINAAQMNVRTRTTKSGAAGKASTTMTMSVTSEPISYNVSEALLLQEAALALAKSIRDQTAGINEPVKPGTGSARTAVEKAYAAGKLWATKRYSGGKIGMTPPLAGERSKYKHSGRLIESIVARYAEKTREFVINYAANRWNPADWKSIGDMQVAIQRWIDRVPALKEPSADLGVQRAFRSTHEQMVQKHKPGMDHKATVTRMQILVRALQTAAQALGG